MIPMLMSNATKQNAEQLQKLFEELGLSVVGYFVIL